MLQLVTSQHYREDGAWETKVVVTEIIRIIHDSCDSDVAVTALFGHCGLLRPSQARTEYGHVRTNLGHHEARRRRSLAAQQCPDNKPLDVTGILRESI